ncbi:MAG: 3-isopropylmalate dehydrogenase [Myxococcales bacterium]|nr:3-isopropylmalate dehydrogenase [Myxococcales bacterium]
MDAKITLLPGDGIGPEITEQARLVLAEVASKFGHVFQFSEKLVGGCAIDETGTALPDESLDACRASDGVILGAVGGPKWDDPNAKVRPEQGLLALRKGLGLYANLRPVTLHPALASASPLKEERLAGVDIMVVRELTGGIYFGSPRHRAEKDGVVRAIDTMEYSDYEVRRMVQLACKIAKGRQKRVTSVDKANVLESSRLWRQVADEVAAEHTDITLDHQLVDSAAMRLITQASSFDVIVTGNMFGDILSDEASVLTGSLGLLPSASLGDGKLGMYEPIHGSAPDIAGKGIANPMGTILSAAMLLRHSLDLETEAKAIETAVFDAVTEGARSTDLGGDLSTKAVGEAVCAKLR